jgi:predicted amino acid dehydrogenase
MNVSPELIKERPDIVKIDGAYVDINGIDLGFDMGPPKRTTFACLVETMMIALEGDKNHHVGEIDERYLEKTKEWAKKYGFAHAPFTSFGKPISLN